MLAHVLGEKRSTRGVEVTSDPFINSSVKKIFGVAKRYLLYTFRHIYIWQVSPQLSCDKTCQKQ